MAESRLPRTVWVGGYEFPLTIVDPADPRLDGADGLTNTGEDAGRGVWVCSNLGTFRTIEVVLHELTHAINWAYDVANEDDVADEEAIATKHGHAWARLYLDNPKFHRWLSAAINRVRRERATA